MKLRHSCFLSIVVTTLAACGGDGGAPATAPDDGVRYTGAVHAAQIDGDLVQTLFDHPNTGLLPFEDVPADGATALRQLSRHLTGRRAGIAPRATTLEPLKCDSGSSSVISDLDETRGSGSATLIYRQCVTGDMILDGKLVFELLAPYDTRRRTLPRYRLSYHAYSTRFGKLEDSVYQGDYLVSSPAGTPGRTSVTINMTTVDRLRGRQLRFVDVVHDIERQTVGDEVQRVLRLSGRVYHSLRGYVDLTTLRPLRYDSDQQLRAEGEIELAGAGSRARVRRLPEDASRYSDDVFAVGADGGPLYDVAWPRHFGRRITRLDENGDGVWDKQSTVVDNAYARRGGAPTLGSDGIGVTAARGQALTLECGDCFDDDGDFLTLSWRLARTPGGAPATAVGGTGPTFAFTPAERGVYEFELTVSDGKNPPVTGTVYVLSHELGLLAGVEHPDFMSRRFSPSTNRMLTFDNEGGASGFLIDLGTGQTLARPAPAYRGPLLTTPDGKRLLSATQNGYSTVSYETGAVHDEQLPLVAPQGAQALMRGDGRVDYLDSGAAGLLILARPRSDAYFASTSLLPDGSGHASWETLKETASGFDRQAAGTLPPYPVFGGDGRHFAGYTGPGRQVEIYDADGSGGRPALRAAVRYAETGIGRYATRAPALAVDPRRGWLWIERFGMTRDTLRLLALYDLDGRRLARFPLPQAEPFATLRVIELYIGEHGERSLLLGAGQDAYRPEVMLMRF